MPSFWLELIISFRWNLLLVFVGTYLHFSLDHIIKNTFLLPEMQISFSVDSIFDRVVTFVHRTELFRSEITLMIVISFCS